VTLEPEERQRADTRGRDRMPWQRAALLVALLSVGAWVLIAMLTRWLLG